MMASVIQSDLEHSIRRPSASVEEGPAWGDSHEGTRAQAQSQLGEQSRKQLPEIPSAEAEASEQARKRIDPADIFMTARIVALERNKRDMFLKYQITVRRPCA